MTEWYTAPMSNIVAVDLGGTNIRTAYFPSPKPPPERKEKVLTHADEGLEPVLDRIFSSISAVLPGDSKGSVIGVGAPGPLDTFAGIILEAPNLPGWFNVPLRDIVADRFKCPVVLGNDANLAALGEWRFGAGRGTKNLIYLTISTGIGGGVINDGKLLLGHRGLAGELGHMSVDPNGAACGCGRYGHLESLASGTAIGRQAEEFIKKGENSSLEDIYKKNGRIRAQDVGEAAKMGDTLAINIVRTAAQLIGHQLASLTHAFNPEVIILGGGVSQLGALLFEPLEHSLREHVMHPAYIDGLDIRPAVLGDDAGLIGAMVLAEQS